MKSATGNSLIVAALAWSTILNAAPLPAEFDPDQIQRLKRGDVIISVDGSAIGDSAHVLAAIDVPMPAQAIWPIMTDCNRAPSYVPNLISCRILERAPNGDWDIREHLSSPGWLLPNFRTVFRSDYEINRRVHFSRVAGDLRKSEGEWLLLPIDEGRATRVIYTVDTEYRSWIPNAWMHDYLADEISNILNALRHECLKSK
ncbi:MAG: SRPBCC family protein [Micropepsaceae bacterium]